MVLEVKKWVTCEKRWRLMIMMAVEFAGSWVSDGQLLEWSVYLGLWFQVGRSPLWWGDIIARGRHGSQSRKLRDYISTETTRQREPTRIRTKPTLSDILPSTSLCFLNLPKQCHQLGNNVQILEPIMDTSHLSLQTQSGYWSWYPNILTASPWESYITMLPICFLIQNMHIYEWCA